jgi:Plavaka transposase
MVELLYSKAQMSEGEVDTLLELFGCSGGNVPFSNHTELHAAIDELTVGDVPWQSFTVRYKGGVGDDVDVAQPKWMSDVHEVFYRDPKLIACEMLANPSYKDGMDFGPYRAFDEDGARWYKHMMSGDWAWDQAVGSLTSTKLRTRPLG